MLLNRKQEGQILLLALLQFPRSGAGTVLWHNKGKRRNTASLRGRQPLRAAQVVLPQEKPQGQRMRQALLADPLQCSLLCSSTKTWSSSAGCPVLAGGLQRRPSFAPFPSALHWPQEQPSKDETELPTCMACGH